MTCLERIRLIRNILLLAIVFWIAASVFFFLAATANGQIFGWPAGIVLGFIGLGIAITVFGFRFFNVMGPPSREELKDCCGNCTDLWQTFDRWFGNYLAISITALLACSIGASNTWIYGVGVWSLTVAGWACLVAAAVAGIAVYWAVRLINDCLGR